MKTEIYNDFIQMPSVCRSITYLGQNKALIGKANIKHNL